MGKEGQQSPSVNYGPRDTVLNMERWRNWWSRIVEWIIYGNILKLYHKLVSPSTNQLIWERKGDMELGKWMICPSKRVITSISMWEEDINSKRSYIQLPKTVMQRYMEITGNGYALFCLTYGRRQFREYWNERDYLEMCIRSINARPDCE